MSQVTQPTKNLIAYWESVQAEYLFLMGISTQVMVKETIAKLKELEKIEQKEKT